MLHALILEIRHVADVEARRLNDKISDEDIDENKDELLIKLENDGEKERKLIITITIIIMTRMNELLMKKTELVKKKERE